MEIAIPLAECSTHILSILERFKGRKVTEELMLQVLSRYRVRQASTVYGGSMIDIGLEGTASAAVHMMRVSLTSPKVQLCI